MEKDEEPVVFLEDWQIVVSSLRLSMLWSSVGDRLDRERSRASIAANRSFWQCTSSRSSAHLRSSSALSSLAFWTLQAARWAAEAGMYGEPLLCALSSSEMPDQRKPWSGRGGSHQDAECPLGVAYCADKRWMSGVKADRSQAGRVWVFPGYFARKRVDSRWTLGQWRCWCCWGSWVEDGKEVTLGGGATASCQMWCIGTTAFGAGARARDLGHLGIAAGMGSGSMLCMGEYPCRIRGMMATGRVQSISWRKCMRASCKGESCLQLLDVFGRSFTHCNGRWRRNQSPTTVFGNGLRFRSVNVHGCGNRWGRKDELYFVMQIFTQAYWALQSQKGRQSLMGQIWVVRDSKYVGKVDIHHWSSSGVFA